MSREAMWDRVKMAWAMLSGRSDRDVQPGRQVDAIDALSDEYREVLVLSDLGDLRYAEIAEVLDIPVGTVKSRLFRARSQLQEQLREFAVASGYIQETTP